MGRSMRIVLSRKGFDSAAGGGPSPIVDGRPVGLPIPSGGFSQTTYGDLDLGGLATAASRGKLGPDDHCHHDPMFREDGVCLFGQCGAAQTHLVNQGVGIGDVFLFFGLFREEQSGEPHHRIFGYQRIERIVDLTSCSAKERAEFAALGHPHALGLHGSNDVIYCGEGSAARTDHPALRLTIPGGPPSLWQRPSWLKSGGLSYHDKPDRWLAKGRLQSVARGQEFVANIGKRKAPREWLEQIVALIEG